MRAGVGPFSRSQILVYGAVAVALLLVGARWIRSADEEGSPPGEVSTYSSNEPTVGVGAAGASSDRKTCVAASASTWWPRASFKSNNVRPSSIMKCS